MRCSEPLTRCAELGRDPAEIERSVLYKAYALETLDKYRLSISTLSIVAGGTLSIVEGAAVFDCAQTALCVIQFLEFGEKVVK